jgi:tight adherence protein B
MRLPQVDDLTLLKVGAIGVTIAGTFALAFLALRSPNSVTNRTLDRYSNHLQTQLAAMFLRVDVRPILAGQAVAVYALVALALSRHEPRLLGLVAAALGLPVLVIDGMRSRRNAKLEAQSDAFVLALANALRSTPSIGDALRSIPSIIAEPLRSEIRLALKQMQLGCTFEEALVLMGQRINSRAFDTAVTTMLIGQRLGGNLPTTLGTVGAAIRELNRLDLMSKTKTSSMRMQMWVIAVAPVVLSVVMEQIMPGYFKPLMQSHAGMAVVVLAGTLWAAALVAGRRILAVSI